MTTLEQGISVTRKTNATIQHKALVATLHAEFLQLRQFGKREGLTTTYGSIFKQPRCARPSATGGNA